MKRILYHFDGAPPSWRVRLGLAFKGIDADIRSLSFSAKEHKSTEMLRLNPRARLPFYTDGKVQLQNSLAILAWLDRAYPGPKLFGEGGLQTAEIWQVVMDGYDVFRQANRQMLSVVFATGGSLQDEETVHIGADLAHAECQRLETRLSDGRSHLVGERPSAADAVIYPEVRLIQRAVDTKQGAMADLGFADLTNRYPSLTEWMDRLSAMPGVAATRPAHWNE